jgi:hypothetical protein
MGFDSDDQWLVDSASEAQLAIRNTRTGHFIEFGHDHMVEYRTDPSSDGFLCLKSTLILEGDQLSLEPTLPWNPSPVAQTALTNRRQAVRGQLVKFHELVYKLGWGGWPGAGLTVLNSWTAELGNVTAIRQRVVQELDIDRDSASRTWCSDVETCLEAGYTLVHFCMGMAMGLHKGDGVLEKHDELRERYMATYKKVT